MKFHVRRWSECWTASDGELVGFGETEQEARVDLTCKRAKHAGRNTPLLDFREEELRFAIGASGAAVNPLGGGG